MEIKKIPKFNSILGNKNSTILKQIPKDSVSFSASKPVEKSQEVRTQEFLDRGLSYNSAKEMISLPQAQYDKGLSLIDNGISYHNALKIAKCDDKQYQRVMDLLKNGCPQNFAVHIVTSGFEKAEKLLKDNPDFLNAIDSSYNLVYEELQNYSGHRIVAQKKVRNEQEQVIKKVIIDDKGNLSKNTTYISKDLIQSFQQNKNKSTIILATNADSGCYDYNIINKQIDIINDENGEPNNVIVSKPLSDLAGAFETTKYVLADYPEEMDILSLIMNDKLDEIIEKKGLKSGEKLSQTHKNSDGSITYDENYKCDGKIVSKKYTEKTDSNLGLEYSDYSYEIKNDDGSFLFKMDRSWRKNNDNTTSTVINGEEYIAKFDDENYEVSISKPNGETVKIPVEKKCTEKSKQPFFDFAKSLPADVLLQVKNIREIEVTENHSGICLDGYYLDIVPHKETMAHEMGHAIDWLGMNIYYLGKISGNKDLLKIYNKEMEKFNNENPLASQEIIDYFSQTGGSFSTGLSEVVADVLVLMTSYGHTEKDMSIRINYLSKYFPETVAKTAELYGYNQIKQ